MKILKKFLTNRIAFIFIAILVQLIAFIGVAIKFKKYFVPFYVAGVIISILALLAILYKNVSPAYKIAWIILISIFPALGGLLYLFFGLNKLSKRTMEKMQRVILKSKDVLVRNDSILSDIKLQSESASNQAKYIRNYSHFPPCVNTQTEYLNSGELTFKRLLYELKKAKKYIFLEYFIINQGIMWNSILDILVDKVKKGLDVRVIYDDAGCMLTLPRGYDKELERLGIKCCIFNHVVPVVSLKFNNRDHRKITVVDGIVGFTGGINLADEYINEYEKYGHWKDTAIMIKGDAVWNFTVMFLSMWDFLRGVNENFYDFKVNFDYKIFDNGYVQPYSDNPLDGELVGKTVYMNLINKANRYIYITTPYLVIDSEMLNALKSAAKKGVDARIIVPHITDSKVADTVAKSYYQTLIESGVKLYEYMPGFIHSKTFVLDDEYGVVGSVNMDFRSLYLHFECAVWMYKTKSVYEVKEDFLTILEKCRQITEQDTKSVKWYKALWCIVLRVFAPMV